MSKSGKFKWAMKILRETFFTFFLTWGLALFRKVMLVVVTLTDCLASSHSVSEEPSWKWPPSLTASSPSQRITEILVLNDNIIIVYFSSQNTTLIAIPYRRSLPGNVLPPSIITILCIIMMIIFDIATIFISIMIWSRKSLPEYDLQASSLSL